MFETCSNILKVGISTAGCKFITVSLGKIFILQIPTCMCSDGLNQYWLLYNKFKIQLKLSGLCNQFEMAVCAECNQNFEMEVFGGLTWCCSTAQIAA